MSGQPPDRRAEFEAMVRFLGGDTIAKRSANGLLRINVRSPEQLAALTSDEILDIRMIGPKCLERILDKQENVLNFGGVTAPKVDYAMIARFLRALGELLRVAHIPQIAPKLSGSEQEHIAGELIRLASWYENIEGESDAEG